MTEQPKERAFSPPVFWQIVCWVLSALCCLVAVRELAFGGGYISGALAAVCAVAVACGGFVLWKYRPEMTVTISETWIRAPIPGTRDMTTINFDDLLEVAWEKPREICFETRTDTKFVLNLWSFGRTQRKEIRRLLSEKTSFYGSAT